MTLLLNGVQTTTLTFGLDPNNDARCTGPVAGAYSCLIQVQVLVGNYSVNVAAYDAAPVNGSIPPTAKKLSYLNGVPFDVVAGKNNALSVTLAGVVKTLSVSALPSATYGTAFGSPKAFTVTAQDPDGYTIVGPYSTPVALANSDGSGATAIATSGSDSPPSGELLSSSDLATLSYNGATLVTATIGASASGATGATASFEPAPGVTAMTATGGNAGFVVVETFTGHFAAGATTVTLDGTAQTVTSSTATSVTALLYLDPSATAGTKSLVVATTGGGANAQSFSLAAPPTVFVVTSNADSGPNTLRAAIAQASAGDAIEFNCGNPCTITLATALPPITASLAINGGTFGNVIVDGASSIRPFFVDSGAVTLANLQVQHGSALGGFGGQSGSNPGAAGGGGAGLGGALFVNKASASAIVWRDYFPSDSATGGKGGLGNPGPPGSQGGSGGGGLVGFGAADPYGSNGSGGGGVLGNGSTGAVNGDGGAGGGGGGATTTVGDGIGGVAYAGNEMGINGSASSGGNGGFGGGGGGGPYGGTGVGGNGGFGGGGGGGYMPGSGGPGGGGGGQGYPEAITLTNGGSLGTISGGPGDTVGDGGGGAAAGPAIFVNAGSLVTFDSGASGNTATGGTSSAGPSGAGGADATPVFNYGGTVNGSATAGPVSAALSGSAPQLRRSHRPLK